MVIPATVTYLTQSFFSFFLLQSPDLSVLVRSNQKTEWWNLFKIKTKNLLISLSEQVK